MGLILFLGANPRDQDFLDIVKDAETIEGYTDKRTSQYLFEKEFYVTTSKVFESIRRHKPRIVHFSGHGNDDCLIIHKEFGEDSDYIQNKDFVTLISKTESVKGVVLNCCCSKNLAEMLFVIKHIEFVVGTKKNIEDPSGISFSKGFYRYLTLERKTFQEAFDEAILTIIAEKKSDRDNFIILQESKNTNTDFIFGAQGEVLETNTAQYSKSQKIVALKFTSLETIDFEGLLSGLEQFKSWDVINICEDIPIRIYLPVEIVRRVESYNEVLNSLEPSEEISEEAIKGSKRIYSKAYIRDFIVNPISKLTRRLYASYTQKKLTRIEFENILEIFCVAKTINFIRNILYYRIVDTKTENWLLEYYHLSGETSENIMSGLPYVIKKRFNKPEFFWVNTNIVNNYQTSIKSILHQYPFYIPDIIIEYTLKELLPNYRELVFCSLIPQIVEYNETKKDNKILIWEFIQYLNKYAFNIKADSFYNANNFNKISNSEEEKIKNIITKINESNVTESFEDILKYTLLKKTSSSYTKRVKSKIKIYDYISEAKLDQIFSQIDRGLKTETASYLGLDIEEVQQIFNTKKDESKLFEKLKFVTNYIENEERITGLENTGDWVFEKNMLMYTISPLGNKNICLFVSKLKERSFLVLCGSRKHMLGNSQNLETSSTFSYEKDILNSFEGEMSDLFTGLDKERYLVNSSFVGFRDSATTQFKDWAYGSMYNITLLLIEFCKYPPREKSFLSRIYFKSSHKHKGETYELILGSPIYIANAEK